MIPVPTSDLTGEETVSMNMWGLAPSIFPPLAAQFREFLAGNADNPKSEFFIPSVVDRLISQFIHGTGQLVEGGKIEPARVINIPVMPEDLERAQAARAAGEAALREGRVGCFLVAGGQGTRPGDRAGYERARSRRRAEGRADGPPPGGHFQRGAQAEGGQ
jgi:hypothetical protein